MEIKMEMEMKNEINLEMEIEPILETFGKFKNDSQWVYKILCNAPMIFGEDSCELSMLLGYEKTIHYINVPLDLIYKYGNEILEEDGILEEARYTRVLGSEMFTEDQVDEILSDTGFRFYYTEMGLSYRDKFGISEAIIDKLTWDLYNDYKTKDGN